MPAIRTDLGEIELRTTIDDPLIAELHAGQRATEDADDALKELREQLTGPHVHGVVTVRRAGAVTAWTLLIDPNDPERYLLAVPVVDAGETDTYRAMLTAALDAARSSEYVAVQWIVQDPDGAAVAAALGAQPHLELESQWRAERGEWPETTAAQVAALPTPPNRETLARYADLYTAAGLSRCDDNSCTDHWTADTVGALLADRDEYLHTTFTLGYFDADGTLQAEASAGVYGDTATLAIVHAQSPAPDLTALLTSTLHRLHRDHPEVRTADVSADPNDDPLHNALTAAGFTLRGNVTEYRVAVD
ncbi:hypothetical protein F5X71_22880 [Nocardia brasiliensis]|uniref:Uncharacterized protein n=1 Tax=Nocardia brasiliensis TaxID=37326 RepID=A0A6G9XV62_NOCBR|nr:hypothetical protein [Nocardia brasiliensis]QIS04797.1 hypothetical protein F5X71_22880 [Nocardia brasiliensis]